MPLLQKNPLALYRYEIFYSIKFLHNIHYNWWKEKNHRSTLLREYNNLTIDNNKSYTLGANWDVDYHPFKHIYIFYDFSMPILFKSG